jgi:hypothetical protein
MKGSAITGPVGKEAAELWPVSWAGRLFDLHKLMVSSVLQATPVSLCKASFLRGSWLGFDSQLHKSSIVSSNDKMT